MQSQMQKLNPLSGASCQRLISESWRLRAGLVVFVKMRLQDAATTQLSDAAMELAQQDDNTK